MMIEMKD